MQRRDGAGSADGETFKLTTSDIGLRRWRAMSNLTASELCPDLACVHLLLSLASEQADERRMSTAQPYPSLHLLTHSLPPAPPSAKN